MSIPPVSQYTYIKDLRPFGHGTSVGYKTALTDLVAGEFVAWSTANGVIRLERTSSTGPYIGISRDDLKGVQALGNQPALRLAFQNPFEVFTSGIHEMLGTAAETYVHGQSVYMSGTDTQKITNVAGGGTVIGTVYLPDNSLKVGAVKVPFRIDDQVSVAYSSND